MHRDGTAVVAIGGGHGLAATLGALRRLGVAPTAIVTMADDGGSSGRLRRDLGLPPLGDLRRALLALGDADAEAGALFGYRFDRGELAGHSLGNLALAALTEQRGGLLPALEAAGRWLGVRGRALPSTLAPVELWATVDGAEVRGQALVTHAGGQVERVWIVPGDPPALVEAVTAVERARLVLLGPGSTFTSIVPNLLVPGLGAAVARADEVVYICNLEPGSGETAGFGPEAHLVALLAHCPGLVVSRVLCQRGDPEQEREIACRLAPLGARADFADLADPERPARHDLARLAGALAELIT